MEMHSTGNDDSNCTSFLCIVHLLEWKREKKEGP